MARASDQGDGYVPPPMPPNGLSQEFIRASQQVGSGPQARAFATGSSNPGDPNFYFPPELLTPGGETLAPPVSLGSAMTPPLLPAERFSGVGVLPIGPGMPFQPSDARDPQNVYQPLTYVPPSAPSPEYAAAWLNRQPSSGSSAPFGVRGRPTAERLGVSPEMGGMPRQQDATFMPSNVLMQSVLADLPPIFQQFANRPISRPEALSIYGPPTSRGGYYSGVPAQTAQPGGPIAPSPEPPGPGNTSIVIGRGVETQESPLNAVNAARHELLHALSFEAQPFAQDANDNFRLLHYAVAQDFPSLQGPQFRGIADKVVGLAQQGDWGHVFTELADLSLRGQPLPPNLQRYFAPMYAVTVNARPGPMTAPPSAPPRG